MPDERWGDRYVSEDTGLTASALYSIEEVLIRIAEALERLAPKRDTQEGEPNGETQGS